MFRWKVQERRLHFICMTSRHLFLKVRRTVLVFSDLPLCCSLDACSHLEMMSQIWGGRASCLKNKHLLCARVTASVKGAPWCLLADSAPDLALSGHRCTGWTQTVQFSSYQCPGLGDTETHPPWLRHQNSPPMIILEHKSKAKTLTFISVARNCFISWAECIWKLVKNKNKYPKAITDQVHWWSDLFL